MPKGQAVTPSSPATEPVVAFVVPGEPDTKARHREGKHGNYNPSEAAEFEVQRCYVEAHGLTEPVPKVTFRLTCVFYTKNRQVKDVDNMWKLVADALQGLVWKNDSQVWDMGGTHREVDKVNPRTTITVEVL